MTNLSALILILFTLSGIALFSISIVYLCNLILSDYRFKSNMEESAKALLQQ